MLLDQLRPNIIVRGPIFPEPVQVIVAIPMGTSVKLIGKGLNTNQVHEPILSAEQLAQLISTPDGKNAISADLLAEYGIGKELGERRKPSMAPDVRSYVRGIATRARPLSRNCGPAHPRS
jgi:hypothetical protein